MTVSAFFLRRLIKWGFCLSAMAGVPIGAHAYGNEESTLSINADMQNAKNAITNIGSTIVASPTTRSDWVNSVLKAANEAMNQKGTDSIWAEMISKINNFN